MRLPARIPAIALIALLAHAASAYGATPTNPTDPSAGSPAGAEYQLPFEKGRADAAPKGSGGTAAPGGQSGTGNDTGESGEPSYYRSENNFGSSSKVPGALEGGAGSGSRGASGGSDGTGGSGGAGGSGRNGGNSSGSGSELSPGELTDSGSTSAVANIGLLLLIGLVATGVGVFSAARLRTHRQHR